MNIDERLHCPACGYNLRGLPDGDCPECGTPFERATLSALEQPTVSAGTLRAFAVGWPVLYLVGASPISALIVTFMDPFPGLVLFGFITTLICYPVCKDLARQTARTLRLNQIEAEPVSDLRLLLYFWPAEVVAILLLAVGLSHLWGWF